MGPKILLLLLGLVTAAAAKEAEENEAVRDESEDEASKCKIAPLTLSTLKMLFAQEDGCG